MKRNMRIAGIGAVLIATTAFAQDGVTLKYTVKKDQVTKYKVVGKLDFNGAPITAEVVNKETVAGVAEDGTATVLVETEAIKIEMNGETLPTESPVPYRRLVTATGEVKELQGESVTVILYRNQNLMGLLHSTEAVKVGSKWTRKIVANKDTGAVAMTANYEILGEETVKGTNCFKIKFKHTEGEGEQPGSIEGTMWVGKDNSGLYKSVSKWTDVPMEPAPIPITGEFTTTRE